MIMIVSILFFTALCFSVLSFSVAGLWPYCTPAALVLTLLWMHVVDGRNRCVARAIVQSFPNLLLADERAMFLRSPSVFVPQLRAPRWLFSGGEVVSVVQTAAWTGLAYGVLSIHQQAWTPALLSFGVFLYALLGPLANAFPASSHVDSEARAIDRCRARVERRGGDGGPVASELSQDLDTCYWRTLDKLHSIPVITTQDRGRARRAHHEPQVPTVRRPLQRSDASVL